MSVGSGIVFQSIRLNPTRRTPVWVLLLLATLLPATKARAQLPSGGEFEPVVVDSVDVEGNIRQADLTIIDMGGLTRGSAYTIFDIQRATKAMWATGQFNDISVRVEGNVGDGTVTLIWEVDERDLLRNVAITGLTNVDPGDITDGTPLNVGFPYSPAAVLDAKASIRAELATKGIPFANIVERIERVPNRGKEIVLFLDVEEGTRVTVADVTFSGNTTFSDSDLRGAMSVKSEGFWWWKSGLYDRERYDEDLQTGLPDLYAASGFLDFRVVGDSLIIDPVTGKTRLEISVDEGPQYRLREFTIDGNSEFSTDELQRIFQPEQGGGGLLGGSDSGETELPIFDNASFGEATGVANELYQNEGYLYAQVVPFVRQNEGAEGEVRTVDVGWAIDEGPQAYISRVNIEGNEYTYSRVIRDKIFVLPGDVYSQERIIQSFQSISSLGYFEPMQPPSIVPNQAGDVDITFTVVEKPTGAVNFGTTIGGGTGGLTGFIGYDQPNLFGKGKSASLRWDYGEFQNNQVISYSDPGVFESLVSANVNLFNARDRFISFRSGRRKRIGGDFRLGFLIPGARFTRFFTGYGLSRTVLELQSGGDDLSLFGIAPGTQSTVSVGVTRSTLNHPLFPTVGSRQSVNVAYTGGPLGGDGNFVKYTADGSWWLPIGGAGGDGAPGSGITFALGMTMRTGALQGNSAPFPFDGFWMGGVQFGQQLRGYDETTITPLGYFDENSRNILDIARLGHAFFSMTTEVAMRMGQQMSASIFMDAGNVWRHAAEIDPSQLFRGAGVGIQLVTPFGPIGLDYAYGFDKTVPGWQLHFRLGGGL